MSDRIFIHGLRVPVRIGITAEERAEPQELRLDVEIEPLNPFAVLEEAISRTVDYHSVSLRLADLSASREWHLIETLAQACAQAIVTEFPAAAAVVTVRKFILPQTDFVAARTEVRRAAG